MEARCLLTCSRKTEHRKLEVLKGMRFFGKQENRDEKRYSEEPIVYALKRIESGTKGMEMCREMGISEPTLYNWKRKFSGGCVVPLSYCSLLRHSPYMESRVRRGQAFPLPDEIGYSGMFAGVSHGTLFAGGGSQFRGGSPWAGGTEPPRRCLPSIVFAWMVTTPCLRFRSRCWRHLLYYW